MSGQGWVGGEDELDLDLRRAPGSLGNSIGLEFPPGQLVRAVIKDRKGGTIFLASQSPSNPCSPLRCVGCCDWHPRSGGLVCLGYLEQATELDGVPSSGTFRPCVPVCLNDGQ